MQVFEKAFGRLREVNTKKRSFGNILKGIGSNYLESYQIAINEYNVKNLDSALKHINRTIKKADINDWKHYAFRANVYEDLGKFSAANKEYEQAIEYADEDSSVYALYHQIGFCNLSLGNNSKAVEFFSYAINLKKEHPNSEYNPDPEGMEMGVLLGVPFKRMYNNRANALLNMNELNESLEDCQKSLSFDNNYSNPYLLLSQIFSKDGQEEKAIEFLKMSAQLGNTNAISMLQKIGLL